MCVCDGAFDSESFHIFTVNLISVLQNNPANHRLIMDNCRIHDEKLLSDTCNYFNVEYKFLPPYSPMLNPIEECISEIKRTIKTQLSISRHHEVMNIINLPWGQKTIERRRILSECLISSINSLSLEHIHAYTHHLMSFIHKSITFEDV